MSIPGAGNPLLLGGAGGYKIERSLRFNSADSAYLSRTPASAGNRKTWTFSFWCKRTSFPAGITYVLGAFPTASIEFVIGFTSNQQFYIQDFPGSTALDVTSAAVFRDPSAWYHFVVSVDTTQATASNRVRLYANGSQITSFTTATYPTQNYDVNIWDTSQATAIGARGRTFTNPANYYLADIHFIDGQALTPSSFGETDANGIWQPKAYSGGSYGTNGFQLKFADNSAATATTLGKDTSGNSNNWTPNNLSVTAGAGNDSLVDSPTNYGIDTGAGGEVRGNYCTLNPLDNNSQTLANGNLDVTGSLDTGSVNGTIAVSSGKYYWEVTASASNGDMVGIWSTTSRATSYPGATADSYGYNQINGQKYNNGSGSVYGATFSSGDVIGVALDMDAGTLVFYKNGVSQGTAFSSLTGSFRPSVRAGYTGNPSAGTFANFGQRPFAYTAPSGFKALCTQNLPEGTITTSGSFTGNANADGPFVYLNGVPTAMTINSNVVTFGTHADKLSNGFKLRTNSTSYNTSGSNTYTITTTGAKFKNARAQSNP